MPLAPTVCHLHPPTIDLPLLVVLTVAGLVTALLLGLALAGFARRQSRSYLLIAVAVAALFARTGVAGLSMMDLLSANSHHLLEHALDVVFVALVIGAVYYARTVDRQFDRETDL